MAKKVTIELSVDSSRGTIEIQKVGNALDDVGNNATKAGKAGASSFDGFSKSLTATVDVFNLLQKAGQFLFQTFKDGVKEITETEEGLRRLDQVSKLTGLSLEGLNQIAADFASDGLVQMDEAMQQTADLAKAGFDDKQIKILLTSFKDLAATAGGDVSDNISALTEGLAKNKIAAEDAAKMLPSLKENLKAAGLSMADLSDETKKEQVQAVIMKTAIEDGNTALGNHDKLLETVSGKMQVLENRTADFKEAFSTAFIESMGLGAVKTGEMNSKIAEMETASRNAGQGLGLLTQALGWVLGKIGEVYAAMGTLIQKIIDLENGSITAENANKRMAQSFVDNADKSKMSAAQLEHLQRVQDGLADKFKLTETAQTKSTNATKVDVFEQQAAIQSSANAADKAKKLAEELKKKEAADKAAAAASKAHAEAMDKLKTSFIEGLNATTALATKIKNLQEAGVTNTQIIKGMSAEIVKVADAARKAGDGVDPLVASLEGAAAVAEQFKVDWMNLTNALTVSQPAWIKAFNGAQALRNEIEDSKRPAEGFGTILDQANAVLSHTPVIMDEVAKSAMTTAEKISILADTLASIPIVGQAISIGLKAGIAAWKETGSVALGVIGGISAGMQGLGDAIGGTAGAVVSALGRMGSAFVAGGGGLTGLINAAVQGVIELATALFKIGQKDWFAATSKTVTTMIGGLEISNDLMKKIAENAKKLGSEVAAGLKALPEIFSELGVTSENFMQLAQATQDVLSGVEQGIISASDASQILNEVLPQLLEGAIKFGDAYLDRLDEIIQMAQAAGISVDALRDALTSAIADIQGKVIEQAQNLLDATSPILDDLQARIDEYFKSIPEGMGVLNSVELETFRNDAMAFAGSVLDSFNAMRAAGLSVGDALAKIHPQIEQLKGIFKDLGISLGSVGLGWLVQLDNINSKFPQQIAAINAVKASLEAMNNLGIKPTAAQFQALQNTASNAFDKINADGKISRGELQAVLPTLYALSSASEMYGFTLDDDIQKLIDAAKKQGQWKEADAAPTLEQSMVKLLDVLERLNAMLATLTGSASTYAGALNTIPSEVNTTVTTEYNTRGEPPEGLTKKEQKGGPGYQGLREPIRFQGRRNVTVDDDEILLPARFYNSNRGLNALVGGSGGSGGGNTYIVNVNVANIDYSDVGQFAEAVGRVVQRKLQDLEFNRKDSADSF